MDAKRNSSSPRYRNDVALELEEKQKENSSKDDKTPTEKGNPKGRRNSHDRLQGVNMYRDGCNPIPARNSEVSSY